MSKKRSKQLARQLAQYGALSAIMAAGTNADGQIIYTDENPDFAGGSSSQYLLDLNNDGDDDFRISGLAYGPATALIVEPLGSSIGANAVLVQNSYYAAALNMGQAIDSNASFYIPSSSSGLVIMNVNYPGNCYGEWCNETDKYLGFQFKIAGVTHYGWARMDATASNGTWVLKDYAYESAAGVGIAAGDTSGGGNSFPTANCQGDMTIALDENGTVNLQPADIDNGSSDPEGPVTLALNQNVFECDDIGANQVTLIVTDTNGQQSTCTVTITIEDDEAPVITNCSTDEQFAFVAIGEQFTVPDYATNLMIEDNCGAVNVLQTPAAGTQIGPGTIPVAIEVVDPSGNTSTCSFDLTVLEDGVGTEDTNLGQSISFFPNPTTGQLTISRNSTVELLSAEVMNVNGKVLKSIDLTQSGEMTNLSLEGFASGVYFVRLKTATTSGVKKIIKE